MLPRATRKGDGLSPTVLLKNVGAICDPCGAGQHWACVVLTDRNDPTIPQRKKRKMCMCQYTTHPYLSPQQLEAPPNTKIHISVAVPTSLGAIAASGKIEADLRRKTAPSVPGLRVSKESHLSNP